MINMMTFMTRFDGVESKRRRDQQSLADVDLVARFLSKRDMEDFEILVRRHRDKVFALATSILGRDSGSEAEDATQEVFIVIYRQLASFRGDAAFSTWLYRVARNQISGFRRRRAHRVLPGGADGISDIPDNDSTTDPLSVVAENDVRQQLLQVVDELSETQRVIVHLFYWQEQSVKAIGSLLEVETNTIKSHLRRARIKLAEMLQETDLGN